MKLFQNRAEFFLKLYFIGIALMLIALPLSKFLMSISQIVLIISWFGQGRIKERLKQFIHNKSALVFSSLYLLHIIGLIYTCNIAYALEDLKIKIPILLFPLIFSTSPIPTKKQFETYLDIFIFSVFFSTFCSILVFIDVIHREITDIRNISIFISHIRLSLMICMAILILIYRIIKWEKSKYILLLQALLIFWFLYFLVIIESITGQGILLVVGVIMLFYAIYKSKRIKYKLAFLFAMISIILIPIGLIAYQVHDFYKQKNSAKEIIKEKTKLGNPYIQYLENKEIENSSYVWRNIQWDELKDSWNKRSKIDFNGFDLKGQNLSNTLIRFLTSKGQEKDANNVESLSSAEIKSIESGIANYKYQSSFSFNTRIHEIIWEYDKYKTSNDPNGHSVTQRFEYWKTSWFIIKNNLLIGVGTGDIDNEFERAYNKTNSPLNKKYQFKSHNQYLRIAVLFGFIGLVWFLSVLAYPLFDGKRMNYYYAIFILIAIFSMISEDTLETQAGITFFAFFNSFFYYLLEKE